MNISNQAFEKCMPNSNDEVELSSVLEELARSAGYAQSVVLRSELSNIFENWEASMISRQDFVNSLMVKKTEAEQSSPLASPLVSPIDAYGYHGRKSSSEASELEDDLRRSPGSIPSSVNCSCSRNKEVNLQLAKIISSKDRKIWKLQKDFENLMEEISSSINDEEVLKSCYTKKIEDLRHQLKEAKENYSACCRTVEKLDDVEYELNKCHENNKYLTLQMTALKEEHRTAQDQIASLDEKLTALVAENQRLKDENDEDKMVYLKVEELRNEKRKLQEMLVNVSVSMIPNLLDISEEEISPDSTLIPIPARKLRKMSLGEELALLPERRGAYPMIFYPGELSIDDKSTSSSDLIPGAVEHATQTEADVTIPRRRIPNNVGTQTGEVLLRAVIASESIVLVLPQSSISSLAEIQSEAQQESRLNISATQDKSMTSFRDISSLNNNYSGFSLSSETFLLPNILSTIVYLVILLVCALVFYPDLMTHSELITQRFCNWIFALARKSVKIHYTREIPPH